MTLVAAIYSQVPEVNCKGLCQQACGPIGCSGIEAVALQDAGHALPRTVNHPTQGALTCSHLSPEGRCRIYEQRPLVCRLFGATPAMRCPHGCRPQRFLQEGESRELLRVLKEASDAQGLAPWVAP